MTHHELWSPHATVPEGVEIIKIGAGTPQDFELAGGDILKGRFSPSRMLVRPKAGYEFAWDIGTNKYVVRAIGSGPAAAAGPLLADALKGGQSQIVVEPPAPGFAKSSMTEHGLDVHPGTSIPVVPLIPKA